MITVDRKARKPLHRQIYDACRAAIVNGGLRPGQRVPSTRVLAAELGVSRFTVLNAYAQLLAEEYFESRVGAGSVVSSSLPDQLTSSESTGARLAATRSGPLCYAKTQHDLNYGSCNIVTQLSAYCSFHMPGWFWRCAGVCADYIRESSMSAHRLLPAGCLN
jgi:DNA-binding transcriptional regulator YhcF (GntR family)